MPGLFPDFNDPEALSQLGVIGTLLSARKGDNWGQALQNASAAAVQRKTMERADRGSELQTLTATYKILKDEDQQARANATVTGQPYVPNPLLAVHEARLSKLMGVPLLAGGSQQPLSSAPAPQIPAAQASQTSPVVNQDWKRPEVVQAVQQMQQKPPSLPEMLKVAGIPQQMAITWMQTPHGQDQLFKHLAEVFGPRVVNNVMMQLGPDGSTRMLGGMMGQDVLPVGMGPDGKPQVQPIAGATDYFAKRAGAVTGAQEDAKAPYSFNTYPTGPNGAPQIMSIQRAMQMERGNAPPGTGLPIPTRQPQVAQVTPRGMGGGLTGADPVRVAADTEQAKDVSKFHAQTYVESQQADRSASLNLTKLDRFEQLMQGIETGKLTPSKMTVSAYAKDLGFTVDPKLDNLQAAQAMTGQMALENRNPAGGAGMPGAMSDADRKFLQSMTPGLEQTSNGRKLIIETKRKLLQREKEVAQLARDYKRQNRGQMDDGFYQALADFSASHPLFPQQEVQSQTLRFDAQGKPLNGN